LIEHASSEKPAAILASSCPPKAPAPGDGGSAAEAGGL
jgi:hypothetical protein